MGSYIISSRFKPLEGFNTQSLQKAPNDSWIRRAERPPVQAQGQGQMHLGVEEEAEIREMEDGLNP